MIPQLVGGLVKVLQFAQIAEENAGKHQVSLPAQLHDLIIFPDDFTDRMIECGNKLFGIERAMTPEEEDAYEDLEVNALYGAQPIAERLVMLQKLWENPLVIPSSRTECLEKAIELVKQQARKRPEKLYVPMKN